MDTPERFDAILSQPSNPWLAGMSNLFTRDFYEIVRGRLAEGGVFAQWIQLYEMSAETLSSMLAAFRSVFPDAHLFITAKADLILVAPAPSATFHAERLRDERVRASLERAGVSPPEHVLAYYACDLDDLPPPLVAEETMSVPQLPEPQRTESSLASGSVPAAGPFKTELKALERQRIIEALQRTGGNQSRAARELGLSRHTLMQRMELYGLARPRKKTKRS